MSASALDKIGSVESVAVSGVCGTESSLIGGMVKVSWVVGAVAWDAVDVIGPLETTDGWAKISYLGTYGGSSGCIGIDDVATVEYGTVLTDSSAANSHFPEVMAVCEGAMSDEVTEETDAGGLVTACVVVKNYVCAVAAADFVDHGVSSVESDVGGIIGVPWCWSVVKVPVYILCHDGCTVTRSGVCVDIDVCLEFVAPLFMSYTDPCSVDCSCHGENLY